MLMIKRALRGYAESAVLEQLKLRQENHRLRMQGLKQELMTLQISNGKLRRELEVLELLELLKPFSSSNTDEEQFNQWAAEKLLQVHKEQSGIVWEAMEKLRERNEDDLRVLENKQRDRNIMLKRIEMQMKQTFGDLAENEVQ